MFLDLRSGRAPVVNGLVDVDDGLEVVQETRPVQRAEVEILSSELVLCQERTEYEDGIIAASPGLRIAKVRQITAVGLLNACRRSAKSATRQTPWA